MNFFIFNGCFYRTLWLMNMLTVSMFALVMVIPEGDLLGQDLFLENISSTTITRTVLSRETGEILFDETRSGHPGFNEPTTEVSFQHSLLNIEPPLLPNGLVQTARLKLFLKQHGHNEIELAVDSILLENASKRILIAGENGREAIELQQTQLENGQLKITISGSDTFILFRSTFSVDYIPAEPMDVASDKLDQPENYVLEGNYPNPFNPTTTIIFVLPVVARVKLEVFNVNGQHVKTLECSTMMPGRHTIEWDGKDSLGQEVVSGLYLYRLQAGQFIDTRKMILLK